MNNLSKRNKLKVTQKERKFLLENEVCRVATSHDDIPHVVPVAYIYDKKDHYFRNRLWNKEI